jgi:hypothetical protein
MTPVAWGLIFIAAGFLLLYLLAVAAVAFWPFRKEK